VSFSVQPAGVEEIDEGDPREVAAENALRKAHAVRAAGAQGPILGVDTLVTLNGAIYGKPADELRARTMLCTLSGHTHEVLSGLALLLDGEQRTAVACTSVSFRALSEGLLDWYLAKGEWQGRAGGYAIQGAGAALVRSVHGDYENVVGLPLAVLLDLYPELLGCKSAGKPVSDT
jgi:septum formation protein